MTFLEAALSLAEEGFRVFPLGVKKKEPALNKNTGGRGFHDATTDPDQIRAWWSGRYKKDRNIGIATGGGLIVFDIDDLELASIYLHHFPHTFTVNTRPDGSRFHLYYRFEEGSLASKIKNRAKELPGIDVRTTGGYVMAPPSIHPDTLEPYVIHPDTPGYLHVLTDEELTAIYEVVGEPLPGGTKKKASPRRKRVGFGGTLKELLDNPPTRKQGKTNEWLTRVAGHLAKQYHNKEDLYWHYLNDAVGLVDPDYEDTTKVGESVWNKEHGDNPERAATEENGWIVGNGTSMFVRVQDGKDEEAYMRRFAKFDIEALGTGIDEDNEASYWVKLHGVNGVTVETVLPSRVVADAKRLREWSIKYGFTSETPNNLSPRCNASDFGSRILDYIQSQNPPSIKVSKRFGWSDRVNGFVTDKGVITKDGFKETTEAGARVDVDEKHIIHEYGFQGELEEAQNVLEEVLTYQDETVTSVFGAWWATCFLKPLIMRKTSMFPVLGLEAPSESGKTNGFFNMMVQLNGNARGQSNMTVPVLRDRLGTTNAGIIWVDDMDSIEPFGELIRATTSQGSVQKYDRIKWEATNYQLEAPLFISGETLGLKEEKALVDRTILLHAPSPRKRKSNVDPTQSQWWDVQKMIETYPDGLHVFAGWFVQFALQHSRNVLKMIDKYRREGGGTGRTSEKQAILFAGACLLDAMTGAEDPYSGEGPHASRVAAWILSEQNKASGLMENTVTLKTIPWAIRTFGENPLPVEGVGRLSGINSPVLVRSTNHPDGRETVEVFVRPAELADAVRREYGRVSERTETETAIRDQLRTIRAKSKVVRVWNNAVRYIELPPQYATYVVERARDDKLKGPDFDMSGDDLNLDGDDE